MHSLYLMKQAEGYQTAPGYVQSVPAGKTAGDGESFIYDPSESRQVDEVKNGFLAGEKGERGFFCLFHQIKRLPESKTGLHECCLGEVYDEPQSPQSLFFFSEEVFTHGYIYHNMMKQ
jgi:hypothetical protein